MHIGMKRGRNKPLYWRRHVFLSQHANITSMPSKYECNRLKEIGLGESNRSVVLSRRWNIARARRSLYRMYPNIPLSKIGFDIAKCDKMRRLTVVDVNSVEELETVLRNSLLILIPHSDITLPFQQLYQKVLIKTDSEELPDSELSSGQTSQTELSNEISFKSENIPEDDGNNTQLNILQANEDLEKTNISKQSKTDNVLILHNFLNVYESNIVLPDYLTEEMFTLFWKSAEKEYFRGEAVLVPFVPIHRSRKDRNTYKILGKILGHMWMTLSTVPLNIARTTYLHIGNPMRDIPDNILLEDMLMFVTQEERVLLEKALQNFSKLTPDELTFIKSFFLSSGYYDSLNATEFREQLLSLATDLIIHKPKELVIQMRNGFPADSLASFLNIAEKDQISHLLDRQKPTVQKVLNILTHSAADLSSEQRKVFYYLQMYIQSLVNNNEQLLRFIFFVSGTAQMPKQISVTFNNATGSNRQIMAYKCSCTLELSFNYSCYQEFKREITSYLSSCLT